MKRQRLPDAKESRSVAFPFLLQNLLSILACYVPSALVLAFGRAGFVHFAGRRFHNTFLASAMDMSGVLLGLSVGYGVYLATKQRKIDTLSVEANKRAFVLVLVWSLFLAACFTFLYSTFFAVGLYLNVRAATHLGLVDFLQIWMGDPKQLGFFYFVYLTIMSAWYTAVSLFVALFLSHLRLLRRI